MKKISHILIACIAVLFSSCSALDLSPQDWYGSGNFWNNEAQVKGYMNGLHANLRSRNQMFYILGEARGGTQRVGTSSLNTSLDYSSPIKGNQFTRDHTGVSGWYSLYNNIMQVNHFIDNVEEGCSFLSDTARKNYLGQAYGLRAFYYSFLLKTFGGVPLITDVKVIEGKISADKLYTKRSTPAEIIAFIKDDLKRSEDNFGNATSTNKVAWNKDATLMLKADTYLWTAKVNVGDHKAAGEPDLLIAKAALEQLKGKYKLRKDFSTIFTEKANEEVIFAIRFRDGEATNFGSAFVYSENVFVGQRFGRDGEVLNDVLDLRGNGLLRHEYKSSLWEAYDEEDSRRDKTFYDHYLNDKGEGQGLVLLKCLGIINSNGNRVYESDMIVYRYADVILKLAEVENSLGNDCSSYINEIRERAYGDNYSDAFAYTNGSFEENELAILAERDKEFVWEGKRWFDMVRMHDANGTPLAFKAEANYPETPGEAPVPLLSLDEKHKLLWPINVGTLNDDNLLEQTPGYEE